MRNDSLPEDAARLQQMLVGHPGLTATVAEILSLGASYESAANFLASALRLVKTALHGEYVAVVRSSRGEWTVVEESGTRQALPTSLLADALDDAVVKSSGRWQAAPLEAKAASAELLVIERSAGAAATPGEETAELMAGSLGQALKSVRERHQQQWRIVRLETILDVAARWSQHHQVETLLTDMAEAATRLVAADRASIFLWDRPSHTLVARPALGVKEEELRIPDHAGIVGQVVHTGESMRVDLKSGQEQINREVDARLKYRTRTVLCVPLRSRRGETLGAFEAINKKNGDFDDDDQATLIELAEQAAVALENVQERQALLQSRRLMSEQAAKGVQLIGQAPAIEALRSTIRRVAATDLAVLILGENGTGKEVVSQSIHYLSHRRDQPFVAVNCAAISETLLESELFGHEKGAFTDAHEAHAGKFELASGGTLFLDEIGDLSTGGQSKLLRVLEEKLVVRVGGSKPIHTDARVIAATNQDLAVMVADKKFRQDLYFRLNVVTLQVPPLRQRPEDIALLADHFLQDFCRKARRPLLRLTTAARRRLEAHTWPGNVRELRNMMERLAYLSPTEEIDAGDPAFVFMSVPSSGNALPTSGQPLAEATDVFQVQYIQQAIDRCRGNMQQAAHELGLHRSNLYRKMRQLGMATAR
ncbi:MAG TPA: sigma-54-dependent Fis family transcriptional regulator [Pirellulales bacterium]|nr:sigma-54-dependent Fis family transcriptional regulator [Pirellulales bacterium]